MQLTPLVLLLIELSSFIPFGRKRGKTQLIDTTMGVPHRVHLVRGCNVAISPLSLDRVFAMQGIKQAQNPSY